MKYLLIVLLLIVSCNKKIAPPLIQEKVVEVEKIVHDTVTIVKEVPIIIEKKTEIREVIYFEFDSYFLRTKEQLKLDNIVNSNISGKTIKLTGGGCPIGGDKYNLKLGYSRGNSVHSYFSRFVDNMILVNSVGENDLVTTAESQYHLNRRCEIVIE